MTWNCPGFILESGSEASTCEDIPKTGEEIEIEDLAGWTVIQDTTEDPAEEIGKHDPAADTGKHDLTEGTGKHDSTEGTGKHGSTEGTGKHDSKEGTGKHDSKEGTGKHDSTTEGTGKHDSKEGTGKHDSTEGIGKHDSTEGTGKHDSTEGTGKQDSIEDTGKHDSADKTAGLKVEGWIGLDFGAHCWFSWYTGKRKWKRLNKYKHCFEFIFSEYNIIHMLFCIEHFFESKVYIQPAIWIWFLKKPGWDVDVEK